MKTLRMSVVIITVSIIFLLAWRSSNEQTWQEVVRAKRYEIVNAKGETLLTIAPLSEGWPGVGMYWRDEEPGFAGLMILPEGDVLITINDKKHHAQAVLSVSGTHGARIGLDNRAVGGDMVELGR